MQIDSVSEQTGLSIDAIRFYEKKGLLEHPLRTEGGFRLFQIRDIERIRFIRRAQQLGFSLPEIRELLVLNDADTEVCSHLRDLLRSKLATVRGKIREFRRLEENLAKALCGCERRLRNSRDAHGIRCPALESMAAWRQP